MKVIGKMGGNNRLLMVKAAKGAYTYEGVTFIGCQQGPLCEGSKWL